VAGAEHQLLGGGQLVADTVQLDCCEQRAVVVGQDPPGRGYGRVRPVVGQQPGGGVSGRVQSWLGEDVGGGGKPGGDGCRVAGEVEDSCVFTADGIEELD
jgi:hypothetical protein